MKDRGVAQVQLGAMVRYEVKMQWRRRGLPLLMIGLLLGLLLMALWLRSELGMEGVGPNYPDLGDLEKVVWQASVSFLILFGAWPVAATVLMVAIPPIVAETIPRDRQIGVRELIG